MQIAIQTPPEHSTFNELADIWVAADELGFAAGFTFDHLVPLNATAGSGAGEGPPAGPQLEGWVTVSALAARTRNMLVGTLVTGVTYRHPALLAKMAVTLDHVSDGRAILGVGAAWHQAEHTMFGIELPPPARRVRLLDETIGAFQQLCADSEVTFAGEFVKLTNAVFEPKPVHGTIPVLVGGGGAQVKRIAARRGDIFNSFYAPWEWRAVNDELDDLVGHAGRQPSALSRSAFVFCELSGDSDTEARLVQHFQRSRGGTDDEVRRRVLWGSPDQMEIILRSYETAGVDLVVLNLRPPLDVTALERFAAEVLPRFDASIPAGDRA